MHQSVELYSEMKILDLPSWDSVSKSSVLHDRWSNNGLRKLWTAIDDAFQAWDKAQMKATHAKTSNSKFGKQQRKVKDVAMTVTAITHVHGIHHIDHQIHTTGQLRTINIVAENYLHLLQENLPIIVILSFTDRSLFGGVTHFTVVLAFCLKQEQYSLL